MRKYQLLIAGRWVDAASGKTFEDVNPATGEVLANVSEADTEDIDRAVAAARKAFEEGTWGRNIHRAHRMALALRAGVIWLNDYHRIDPASPWGGFKMSGIGRENGLEAIREYTDVKSIWVSLDERPNRWYDSDGTIERLN